LKEAPSCTCSVIVLAPETAMAPAKRQSSEMLSGPAKKAATRAGLNDVEMLIEALGKDSWMPENLPAKARAMLAAGAVYALTPYSEDRHRMQDSVVSNIREALEKAAIELTARVDNANRDSAVKEAELKTAENQQLAAHATMDAIRSSIDAQKMKLGEKTSQVKAADKELKSLEAAQKECTKEQAAYSKEKDKFKAIEESGLQPLVDNALSDKEAKKAIAKFTKDMEKLGADGSMVASVPAVLTKKKEDRQTFDTMVIDQLRATLHERIATIDAALEANESQGRTLTVDIETKQASLQVLQQDQGAETTELQRLQAALAESAKEEGQALELASNIQRSRTELAAAAAVAQGEGDKLQAVRSAFEAMATRTREVPKEQEPDQVMPEAVEPLAVA